MRNEAVWATIGRICVVHLPTSSWVIAGVVNHDAAVVCRVTQIRVENWSITLDDLSHVLDRPDAEGVVTRAHFTPAMVGGAVRKEPGHAKEQRKEHKAGHDREHGAAEGSSRFSKR